MASWPSSLPLFRADGFKQQLGKSHVEFVSDKPGVTKRRRVTTSAPETINGTITCTSADVTELTTFYDQDCGGGALKFDFTHPVTGVSGLAQFAEEPSFSVRPRTGRYLATISLRFWG